MYTVLPLETWNRKDHFQFFSQFDEPFFGVNTEVDCSAAYTFCKKNKLSFFLYYHYCAIAAVNQIPEFRYRIQDNQVIVFDKIHVSTTILRDDSSFSFSFIPYAPTLREFIDLANIEIQRVKAISGLGLDTNAERLDVIHFSTVPWIHFTGISHARSFARMDSVPKITFGKFKQIGDTLTMPLAIHAHHGLLDGFHVGQYVRIFEQLLQSGTETA